MALNDRQALYWIALLALIAALGYGLTLKPTQPRDSDDAQYLVAAYHLFRHHAFSEESKRHPVAPSIGREPGYSLFLAGLMVFAPDLSSFTPECLEAEHSCSSDTFRIAQWANIFFVVAGVFVLYRALRLLGGSPLGGLAMAIIILANTDLMKMRHSVISDYMAFFLVACSMLTLAWAYAQPQRFTRWAIAGIVLAALALTKAVFVFYALGATTIALLWIMFRGGVLRQRHLISLLVIALAFALPVGGWMARNESVGSRFALTESRGGIALSTREVFNHMSPSQYLCSFLYWTRGFGDNLAKKIFPPEVWQPFQIDRPGAFYDYGQNRYAPRVRELMAANGLTRAQAENLADREMAKAILERPLTHMATTLPVFYRGVWIDTFILLTLPALAWLTFSAWRKRRWELLAVLSLGWFNLLFYALASLNIPRYQITAMPALALSGGFAVEALWRRWNARRAPLEQQ